MSQLTHRTEILDVEAPNALHQLCDLLIDCVEGGASVSFMLPIDQERVETFWRRALEGHRSGDRVIFVSRDERGLIVGSVQLVLDLPENQPHRADIAKMLVHRTARRRGLGLALLAAAEEHAAQIGRTLLVLDTVTGDAGDSLYRKAGWTEVGELPGYALFPDGRPCGTTVFYKQLNPHVGGNGGE
jgi:GNAT superfamily N-acetyltransferase